MEYPKINSLWKREIDKNPKKLIEGLPSCEEFSSVHWWRVHEKIDGTNIRISFQKEESGNCIGPLFEGRTKDAQIPCHLLAYLQNHFTSTRLSSQFQPGVKVTLFGEGYGPKIQSAGENYRSTPGFILFDIWISGWWLKSEDAEKIAKELEIPFAPFLGYMSEKDAIDLVKSKPLSRCSQNPQMMEGIVCRSEPLMLFRDGKPIMWKLKCKDFSS